MKPAWYNEIDPVAAQWLRNLIDAGHIAPGDVDERSIEDVRPDELMGYRQCHFFAGIGIWSFALRQADVRDDARVWTGSCPCQPFSTAGKGSGFADERHLWPAFFHLIEQCQPPAVLGEQVAGADADPWIDLVCSDMERLGYTFGATPFPAAGVGAPHIRDRLYWAGILADAAGARLEGLGLGGHSRPWWQGAAAERGGQDGGLAHADIPRREERANTGGILVGDPVQRFAAGLGAGSGHRRPGPVNGHWRDADWLFCRDECWRPVEPGTFPLATGVAGRVGQVRAYGNGLNAEAARIFIECLKECMP